MSKHAVLSGAADRGGLMKNENVHAEHRKRVKNRFVENTLDSFQDHEVLEMLLFFGIPYKNTNELSHSLISRFGSLSGVLDADFDQLMTHKGVGYNTAVLLTLMPQLFRRYSLDKIENRGDFNSIDIIGEFIVNHFIGATKEHVELLLFDGRMNMVDHMTVHEGALSSSDINMERIAEAIFSHRSNVFVLAHNHPSGVLEPSKEDLFVTRAISRAFAPFNKFLLEHFIVADGQYSRIMDRAANFYDD